MFTQNFLILYGKSLKKNATEIRYEKILIDWQNLKIIASSSIKHPEDGAQTAHFTIGMAAISKLSA